MNNTDKSRNGGRQEDSWWHLLLVLFLLMPLMMLFLMPGHGMYYAALHWFWFTLLITWLVMWLVFGGMAARGAVEEPEPRVLPEADQPETVREVMNVTSATEEPSGTRVFRGRLRASANEAYAKLKAAFAPRTVPLLADDDRVGGAAILLVPQPVEKETLEHRSHWWVSGLLFVLTILTTTWAGAAHQGVDLLREPARFAAGLPYSLGLLAILGVHELGHYFAARHHDMRVTPPYFIPVPFALGTFGAFIKMKSPSENRRALFDVAVAGPLAGLAVAIPALLIGLRTSTIVIGDAAAAPVFGGGTSAGSSVLFALLAKLSLGDALEFGHVLRLSPLAFAGWLGLFITALNLLPIGQLDGGHISRALFGSRRGEIISAVAMWSLILLALFVWPGLIIWALIIFFIAGRGTPPLNDLTPVTPGRRWLGYTAFAILALILLPLPHTLWPAAGIHCPYL